MGEVEQIGLCSYSTLQEHIYVFGTADMDQKYVLTSLNSNRVCESKGPWTSSNVTYSFQLLSPSTKSLKVQRLSLRKGTGLVEVDLFNICEP
jgi:hypothetical protein